MRPLLESARSDRPIIELADAKQLFSTLPEMHKLHSRFLVALQERVDELTPTTLLGDLLGGLVSDNPRIRYNCRPAGLILSVHSCRRVRIGNRQQVDELEIYRPYATNLPQARVTIDQVSLSCPAFASFLEVRDYRGQCSLKRNLVHILGLFIADCAACRRSSPILDAVSDRCSSC